MLDIRKSSPFPVYATIALAAVLWFFAFYPGLGNFWIKISFSAAVLMTLAFIFGERPGQWGKFGFQDILWGLFLAAALYGIFYMGNLISGFLFPFAKRQVGGIYARGHGTSTWLICLLLFFITGPAEEIFWRGFVQKRLGMHFGKGKGYIFATLAYTGVHLCTLNFMLIGAAGVAGAFWGFWYYKTERLIPLIISHSVWTVTVFAIFPIS